MFIRPVFSHHHTTSGNVGNISKGHAGLKAIIKIDTKKGGLGLTSTQKSNANKLINEKIKKIEREGVFTERDFTKKILSALQKKKIMSEGQANNFLIMAKGGTPKFEVVSKKVTEFKKAPKIVSPKIIPQKTQEIKKVEKNISGTSKPEVTKNPEVPNKKTPETNKNVQAPASSLSYGYSSGSGKVAQEETEKSSQQIDSNELPAWMEGSVGYKEAHNSPDLHTDIDD